MIIMVIWITPLVATLVTFVLIIFAQKSTLTAEKAFMTTALYGIMNAALIRFPKVMSDIVQSVVGLRRLTHFLLADELDPKNVDASAPIPDSPAIVLDSATFLWEDTQATALNRLTLTIEPGQLVAVIGQVGSGKSALLRALIGSLKRTEGRALVCGQVAYAAQHPWIQNISLRENILFGKHFNAELYERTIRACQLQRDVENISGGDTAEIGEAGSTLSGGQKQRLALARAVYQDADIYLLDDTLSAVDANVGEAIFRNCLQEVLRGKTRILVTQQYQYLSRCDHIIVMKNGSIVEHGTYQQLVAQPDSEFVRLNSNYEAQVAHADETAGESKGENKPRGANNAGPSELMTVEEQEKGSVPTSVYTLYLREAGTVLFVFVLVCYIISAGSSTVANYWLSFLTRWAVMENPPHTVAEACGIYGALVAVTIVGLALRFLTLCRATINASVRIHDRVLERVLRGTMTYFFTTPVGRIMNRFSEDMMTVDDRLNMAILTFLGIFFAVLITICLTVSVLPFFLPFVFPLLYLYSYAQEWFIVYARELFRLDAIGRSPLYARFTETIQGLETIRCMRQVRRFVSEIEYKLDLQQRAYYATNVSNRWLGVRIDCVGALILAVSVALSAAERGKVEGQLLALPTVGATFLLVMLPQLVQSAADLKLSMISVQRVTRLLDVPQEAPITDHDAQFVPPPDWPRLGKVEFRNYYLQYRPELPPAVTNLSITVPPGEKIGVVGRTGAGKSSLIIALFRLSEASGGSVLIDDVDISRVSLSTLRSRLCVIPQDPVLFRGTLRKNLDILDRHSEAELLEALDAVNLRQSILEKSGGLECEVTEGGENFSIGERQLICLARGLLSHASVIVLDEATANVDLSTEEKIHHAIFTKCGRSTMFLIAHRTHTILRCDRVLMMEKGQAIAFGPPSKIIKESKAFADLIKHSGWKEAGTASAATSSAAISGSPSPFGTPMK
jgi:ABC-type multidrug transport system fused ATPase/permease subunit